MRDTKQSTSIGGAPRRFVAACLMAGALALCVESCGRLEPASADTGPAELMGNLLRRARVDIVVAAGPLQEVCERKAARLRERDAVDYRVISLARAQAGNAARIVVGTQGNSVARELVANLGVELQGAPGAGSFQWRDRVYANAGDALIATYEDPQRPGLPVTLYFGNDERALGAYLGDLGAAWKPWVRFFRGGEVVESGPLHLDGSVISDRLEQVGTARYAAAGEFVDFIASGSVKGIIGRASSEVPPQRVSDYVARVASARARTAQWATHAEDLPALTLVIDARVEEFAHNYGASQLASVNPVTGVVHALCAEGLPDDGGMAAARAAATGLLGTPVEEWLRDGAGVDAAGSWWNRRLERWIAWVVTSGSAPTLDELVDAHAAERISQHALVPLRAALFRYLLDTRGASFVRQLWCGTQHLVVDRELRAGFEQALARTCDPVRAIFEERRAQHRNEPPHDLFLAGAGIEESVARGERGFAGAAFGNALDEVHELGTNAIALTSFCVNEADAPRLAGPDNVRVFGPREGDLRLFASLTQCSNRGMLSMLAPNLLSAPGSTWHGSWPRSNEAEWRAFFDDYTRFVVHHALVCELVDGTYLSIGSGMLDVARATVEGRRAVAEEAQWKRDGWSKVIAAARGAYSGRLIYSASSLDEAQKIDFWPALDALGFELFETWRTPSAGGLGSAGHEFVQRIAATLSELEALATANGRPLILTQVGFDAGPPSPRLARIGPGSVDPRMQASEFTLVEPLLRASRERGVLGGFFAWRFSSAATDRGINARDPLIEHPASDEPLRRLFTLR